MRDHQEASLGRLVEGTYHQRESRAILYGSAELVGAILRRTLKEFIGNCAK